ncbi:hypothetical protein [Streptomyces lydicus]|uniref:hypothetical protein n=1 Tax=Streptomyces lydicus TaxID=47763 RepID=UPI00117ED465|nr:hypothetical protein [Streptomyces lydicus]
MLDERVVVRPVRFRESQPESVGAHVLGEASHVQPVGAGAEDQQAPQQRTPEPRRFLPCLLEPTVLQREGVFTGCRPLVSKGRHFAKLQCRLMTARCGVPPRGLGDAFQTKAGRENLLRQEAGLSQMIRT